MTYVGLHRLHHPLHKKVQVQLGDGISEVSELEETLSEVFRKHTTLQREEHVSTSTNPVSMETLDPGP